MMGNEYSYIDRNISLYGMVDNDSAEKVVSTIKAINEYDDMIEKSQLDLLGGFIEKGVLRSDAIQGLEPREPIVLEINSGGGYASSGFSIVSAIESSTTPVVGIVTGDCMSMAVPIFASCHYRISKRFAGFMIHDTQTGAEGKFNDIEKTLGYLKQVRENYKGVLLEYTDIEEDRMDWIINANADFYFTPQEAKEMGVVDAIEDDVDEEDMLRKLYGSGLSLIEEDEEVQDGDSENEAEDTDIKDGDIEIDDDISVSDLDGYSLDDKELIEAIRKVSDETD